jgi:hypothetical protein
MGVSSLFFLVYLSFSYSARGLSIQTPEKRSRNPCIELPPHPLGGYSSQSAFVKHLVLSHPKWPFFLTGFKEEFDEKTKRGKDGSISFLASAASSSIHQPSAYLDIYRKFSIVSRI